MKAASACRESLYDQLADRPAPGPSVGQTSVTRAKETIDNDVERFADDLLYGS
jgi:hypothetical protein